MNGDQVGEPTQKGRASDSQGVTQRVAAAVDPALGGAAQVVLRGVNVALGDIHIDHQTVMEAPSPAPPATNLFQLPRRTRPFVGRASILDSIQKAFDRPAADRATTVAVVGQPGVGKSEVACEAAHSLAGRFRDAQLWADLDAGPRRRDPASVLYGLLRDLGVAADDIPDEPVRRAQLYRDRLGALRALVVLDNVADEAQLELLLPSSCSNGALITSRSSLVTADAEVIPLEPFGEHEALALLASYAGETRVAAEPQSARALIGYAGYLPLTVKIVGARLRGRSTRLSRLEAELADRRRRLKALRAGNLDARACFDNSYEALAPEEQRAFRLLGLLYAREFTAWRVAALLDCSTPDASGLIDELVVNNLVAEARPRGDSKRADWEPGPATSLEFEAVDARFRMHDLLRDFARERAEAEDEACARQAALERVGSGFLQLSHAAAAALEPQERSPAEGALTWRSGDRSLLDAVASVPLEWFATERDSVVAAVERLHEAELWGACWRLAGCVPRFFDLLSRWDNWERTHVLALEAARHAGDLGGEALTLRHLGRLYRYKGRWDAAQTALERSAALFAELADESGEARTLVDLMRLRWYQGDADAALRTFARGSALFASYGDRYGQALLLNGAGLAYRDLGRWGDARHAFEESLTVFRELGDARWEASSLWGLGEICGLLGVWELAIASLRESVLLLRTAVNSWEAVALRSLAEVYCDLERWREASDCLERAEAVVKRHDDELWRMPVRVTTGRVLLGTADLDRARGCLKECVAVFERRAEPRWRAVAELHLARVELESGRLREARALSERVLAYAQQAGDALFEARALTLLGGVEAGENRPGEARAVWRHAERLFSELDSWETDRVTRALDELGG